MPRQTGLLMVLLHTKLRLHKAIVGQDQSLKGDRFD